MRPRARRRSCLLALWLCVTSVASSQPDVAIDGDVGAGGHTSIIEGPDPIPPLRWWPVLEPETGTPLNAQGTERGDGPPHVARDPRTGYPLVIWAYNVGDDHDIAFSEWNGSQWLPIRFLTSDVTNELDPALAIASDGTVHAAWWESAAPDRVVVAVRLPGVAAWSTVDAVQPARRPVIGLVRKILVAACEGDDTDGARTVLGLTAGPSGVDAIEVLDRPLWEGPLGLAIVEEGDRLLLRWRRSERQYGWAEYADDAWVPLSYDGSAPPKR